MKGKQTGRDGFTSAKAKVEALITANPVLVLATSTCPFCIEAKRTLAAHGITGHFIDMDKTTTTAETRKAMAVITGRTSVPQIWINQEHIGGCDDLKALDATGDLGMKLKALGDHPDLEKAEAGLSPTLHSSVEASKAGISNEGGGMSAAVTTYPGPSAAFFLPFHSPATVDNRVVRLNAVLGFIISAVTCWFASKDATQWVVLGLTVDFALKLGGFPSPLGMLAAIPVAGTRPNLSAGASKQFANLCGIFMAFMAWILLLFDSTIAAQVFLIGLAVATALQGFINFCLGCYIFQYLLQWGLVRGSVYRMHIGTRSNTMYAWEKVNVRTGKGAAPPPVTYPTKGVPPNPTDLKAKRGRADDKWERFHPIKYLHMAYFMIPLSVTGLGLPWKLLWVTQGTTEVVWKTLAYLGAVLQGILLVLLVAKCILYPSKVRKEFHHPLHRSTCALPFLIFVVLARITANWTNPVDTITLSRVLFWLGTIPLTLLTLFAIASWVATPVDPEHIQPSWMIIPVSNLMGAAAAWSVNPEYYEWGWFLFGTGMLLWLALWPITFRKAISDHHSDVRTRNLFAIWVAPPAMAMLAYQHLESVPIFDSLQRVLYYPALSLAATLGVLAWPLNFFLEGGFNMSNWAFAFPLDALAAASVLAYDLSHHEAIKVIYVIVLTSACIVNAVNLFATLGALKARSIFTPSPRWSPLIFAEMIHEAFREAVPKLEKLAAATKPGLAEVSTVRTLATAWSAISKAHAVNTNGKERVIFPELESYFPGQTNEAVKKREEREELMSSVQIAINALIGQEGRSGGEYEDESVRADVLGGLRADLQDFGAELINALDEEELAFAAPVARKYVPISTSKALVRKIWDTTPNSDMSDLLGWVLMTLRIRGQRSRFLKAWVWAMPERAQQLGLMVYRVVDDITWVEVARDLPAIVPRGLPGHSRYY